MPEFILDHGSPESARAFRALDSFTQGYIEAMFFTESEPGTVRDAIDSHCRQWNPETQSSLPGDVSFADLAPETLARIIADCAAFQESNADLTQRACDHDFRYTDERAGHDYWLTRNGHGAGFWDRGLGDIGDKLSDAADARGEVWTTFGDDGLIYLS